MTRLSIGILLALATTAAAEPYYPYAALPGPAPEPAPFVDAGYVGGGAGITIDHFLNAFLDIEGGLRLGKAPAYAWASVAYGATGDIEGSGPYRQLRVGLESRGCASDAVCLYLGAFAGTQRQTWDKPVETMEHHSGTLVGGRMGLDAGGTRTRFRIGIEMYRLSRSVEIGPEMSSAEDGGGGVTLAVIHRM
jgi:hypothetical protein